MSENKNLRNEIMKYDKNASILTETGKLGINIQDKIKEDDFMK